MLIYDIATVGVFQVGLEDFSAIVSLEDTKISLCHGPVAMARVLADIYTFFCRGQRGTVRLPTSLRRFPPAFPYPRRAHRAGSRAAGKDRE